MAPNLSVSVLIASSFILLAIIPTITIIESKSLSSSSSRSAKLGPELLSQLPGIAVKTILGRSMSSKNGKEKIRNPMRPVDPLPVGTLDYFTPVMNLLTNIKQMEHNLKKQTYSYGLMVVGRPLEELTLPQKFVRAALMPGKYYQDATSDIAKQFNKYLLTEKSSKSNRITSKSKSTGSKNQFIPWANVLLQLINLAASSLPTPVVKS